MLMCRRNKGFTLLEVVLAVAILSLGLVMVVRSYVSSLRAVKTSQNFLAADLLLEKKIWDWEEQVRLATTQPGSVVPGDEEGNFEAPFDNFAYRIWMEEEAESPPLYKSTFKVSWQQRKNEHSVSSISYTRKK